MKPAQQQQVLIEVFDVGVVIGAPYTLRVLEKPVDRFRPGTSPAAKNVRLVGLSPVVTGVELAGRPLPANLVHFSHEACPVCNALAEPEPLQLICVLATRQDQYVGTIRLYIRLFLGARCHRQKNANQQAKNANQPARSHSCTTSWKKQ